MQSNENRITFDDFRYDPEVDVMMFYMDAEYVLNHPYEASVSYGNVIVDVDVEDNVISIEVLHASKEFKTSIYKLLNYYCFKVVCTKETITMSLKDAGEIKIDR